MYVLTQHFDALSNEQNGPIWTLNGATEGRKTTPLFIGSFHQWDAKYSEFEVQEDLWAQTLNFTSARKLTNNDHLIY